MQVLNKIYLSYPELLPLRVNKPDKLEYFKYHCLYDTDPALLKAILKHEQIDGSCLSVTDPITIEAYETLREYPQFQHLYVFEEPLTTKTLLRISKIRTIRKTDRIFLNSKKVPQAMICKFLREASKKDNVALLALVALNHRKTVSKCSATLEQLDGSIFVKKFLQCLKLWIGQDIDSNNDDS